MLSVSSLQLCTAAVSIASEIYPRCRLLLIVSYSYLIPSKLISLISENPDIMLYAALHDCEDSWDRDRAGYRHGQPIPEAEWHRPPLSRLGEHTSDSRPLSRLAHQQPNWKRFYEFTMYTSQKPIQEDRLQDMLPSPYAEGKEGPLADTEYTDGFSHDRIPAMDSSPCPANTELF